MSTLICILNYNIRVCMKTDKICHELTILRARCAMRRMRNVTAVQRGALCKPYKVVADASVINFELTH